MNAGAYGREMKDIVQTVKWLDYQGEEKEFAKEELAFDYRSSIFKKEKYIITEVTLATSSKEISSITNIFASP